MKKQMIFSLLMTLPLSSIANEPTEHSEPKKDKKNANTCLVSESALEDLKKAREEIETQKKDITRRETELKAKEQALSEELKKFGQFRDSITKSQESKKQEDGEKVAKLIETISTMSPKPAAKLLATLEDDLAVSVMSQLDTQRLAKVMNLMDPQKSSQLSEMLAGVTRAKNRPPIIRAVASSIDDAAVTNSEQKGGEKKDANHEQSHDARLNRASGKQPESTPEKRQN